MPALLRFKNKNKVFGICYNVRQILTSIQALSKEDGDYDWKITGPLVCNRSYEINLITAFSNFRIFKFSNSRISILAHYRISPFFHSFIPSVALPCASTSRPFVQSCVRSLVCSFPRAFVRSCPRPVVPIPAAQATP